MSLILTSLVGMLATKGFNLLSDALSSATDTGVEKIKDLVKEKTGIDISSPESIENMTPEQVIQLRKFEVDERGVLINAILEDQRIRAANTENARAMQVAALNVSGGKGLHAYFIYWYGAILSFVAIAYIFGITWGTIPEANVRFADTCLGFLLGTLLGTIVNFFFGTGLQDSSLISSALGKKKPS